MFAQPEDGTDLTPEEREGIKQTWIKTRADLNEAEQANFDNAIGWTAKIRDRDVLTEDFVFELHKRMFGDVWTWAGTIRRTNKNIGVDKTEIHVRLGGHLRDVRHWADRTVYSPDEIAIRLHHGLVFIHPFPNGNGRHTRLLADLLVAQLGGEPFSWGGGSLQGMGDLRDHYIRSLKRADHHDFGPLLMFARS